MFGQDSFMCNLEVEGYVVTVNRRSADVDEDLAVGISQLNRQTEGFDWWATCISG